MAPEFAGSVYRTVAGGELTPQARDRARTAADNWRKTIAKHGGTPYEPLPPPADNMLGDLDLGLDHLITQTEIEIEAQLPTCERMKADKTKMLHPDTSYTNIRVHHWIKVCFFLPLAVILILTSIDRHASLSPRSRRSKGLKTPPL